MAKRKTKEQRFKQVRRALNEGPKTSSALRGILKVSSSNINNILNAMLEEQQIAFEGGGGRHDPYRYSLTEKGRAKFAENGAPNPAASTPAPAPAAAQSSAPKPKRARIETSSVKKGAGNMDGLMALGACALVSQAVEANGSITLDKNSDLFKMMQSATAYRTKQLAN